MNLAVFAPILAAAALAGASSGLLGVLLAGMRLPFLAVFAAHAALAGNILGHLSGLPPAWTGFLGALAGAALAGTLLRGGRTWDPETVLSVLFSIVLGVAFLGFHFSSGPRSEMFGLLWGSLVLVTWSQVAWMAMVTVLLILGLFFFQGPLRLLLFSRSLSSLMPGEGAVMAGLMILAAAVITVNLDAVGGLLIYGLIIHPAIAALRLARSVRGVLILGPLLGLVGALAGFFVAYALDGPAGATTVLCTGLLAGISFLISTQKRPQEGEYPLRNSKAN